MSSTNTKTFSFLYIHTKKIMAYALRKLLIKFISLLRTAKLAPLKKQLINIFSFLSTGYCDKWLYYAIFVILTGATLAPRLELVPKWYARTHFYIRRHSYSDARSSLRIGTKVIAGQLCSAFRQNSYAKQICSAFVNKKAPSKRLMLYDFVFIAVSIEGADLPL